MKPTAIFDPRATGIPVLRYLVAVAEHRHVGQAAAACQVSQPTLSALISQWERRLRCPVFERSPRGIRVTPVGERIVAAARQALASIAAVENAATEAKPPFFGPVRLGVVHDLDLGDCRHQHPATAGVACAVAGIRSRHGRDPDRIVAAADLFDALHAGLAAGPPKDNP